MGIVSFPPEKSKQGDAYTSTTLDHLHKNPTLHLRKNIENIVQVSVVFSFSLCGLFTFHNVSETNNSPPNASETDYPRQNNGSWPPQRQRSQLPHGRCRRLSHARSTTLHTSTAVYSSAQSAVKVNRQGLSIARGGKATAGSSYPRAVDC